ncbi:MAG: hypothetical protein MJE68_34205 [Proteobacteria bacterium]|nr:hypothetical protein [Pseudomonadota bacterium]
MDHVFAPPPVEFRVGNIDAQFGDTDIASIFALVERWPHSGSVPRCIAGLLNEGHDSVISISR